MQPEDKTISLFTCLVFLGGRGRLNESVTRVLYFEIIKKGDFSELSVT